MASIVELTGKFLATTKKGDSIKVWKLEDQFHLPKIRRSHKFRITMLSFSPDDKYIVSGSEDGEIIIWDPMKGELLNTLKGHSRGITVITFNKNSTLLASGSEDNTIKIWDVKVENY